MNLNKVLDDAIPHNVERLLAELGLEKRRPATDLILPAIGVFAVGVVAGGLLGLLLAPSSGRDLRGEIGKRVRTATDASLGTPKETGQNGA